MILCFPVARTLIFILGTTPLHILSATNNGNRHRFKSFCSNHHTYFWARFSNAFIFDVSYSLSFLSNICLVTNKYAFSLLCQRRMLRCCWFWFFFPHVVCGKQIMELNTIYHLLFDHWLHNTTNIIFISNEIKTIFTTHKIFTYIYSVLFIYILRSFLYQRSNA